MVLAWLLRVDHIAFCKVIILAMRIYM